jgi:hypothetical protein
MTSNADTSNHHRKIRRFQLADGVMHHLRVLPAVRPQNGDDKGYQAILGT